MDKFLMILGAALGSAGLFNLIRYFFERHDNRKDKYDTDMNDVKKAIADLKKEIQHLDAKGDRREAENRRVRILRFEDELLDNRLHSRESFAQVLNDITCYNDYCESHPDFPNEQTLATIAHIRSVYADRLEKHDFK